MNIPVQVYKIGYAPTSTGLKEDYIPAFVGRMVAVTCQTTKNVDREIIPVGIVIGDNSREITAEPLHLLRIR